MEFLFGMLLFQWHFNIILVLILILLISRTKYILLGDEIPVLR